jgi:hypothetical protein
VEQAKNSLASLMYRDFWVRRRKSPFKWRFSCDAKDGGAAVERSTLWKRSARAALCVRPVGNFGEKQSCKPFQGVKENCSKWMQRALTGAP